MKSARKKQKKFYFLIFFALSGGGLFTIYSRYCRTPPYRSKRMRKSAPLPPFAKAAAAAKNRHPRQARVTVWGFRRYGARPNGLIRYTDIGITRHRANNLRSQYL